MASPPVSSSMTKIGSFFGVMFVTTVIIMSYISWQSSNFYSIVRPKYSISSEEAEKHFDDVGHKTTAATTVTTEEQRVRCEVTLKDVVYIFNRKTGSTTLVTLLDRFGRKNRFPLARQVLIHKTQQYYGNFYTYHFAGKNPEGAVLPSPPISRNKRRLLLEGDRTHLVKLSNDGLKLEPNVVQTIYVSIVREPSANFESAFSFFHLNRYVKPVVRSNHVTANDRFGTLDEYFTKPDYYRSKMRRGSLSWSVARNGQTWHLGLQHRYHDNDTLVEEYFAQLEKEIDFVIVTEYYDHSLIILRDLLCWKIVDILYIARRVRSERAPMTKTLADKIHKWNNVDVKLYDRFNKTLWRRIADYGPDFEKDLEQFRKLRDAVTDDCNRGATAQLSHSTLQLLAEAGENEQGTGSFCRTLLEGFSHSFVNIDFHDHGPGSVSVTPRGVQEPMSIRHVSNKHGGQTQCLRLNYAKPRPATKSSSALDVYFSVNSPNLVLPAATIVKPGNDAYTANYELYNVSNLQVLTEAKKVYKNNFQIRSVHLKGGEC
ncbi:galactosylceramide sulfotransferase-like isoform X2 [Ptychodera flava]|uniref:galactosylceramide sulfotransferase-like isoform X2 n=1 Tax=Ptychodera flava TaxID=63121 RepID=UPI00396A7F7E